MREVSGSIPEAALQDDVMCGQVLEISRKKTSGVCSPRVGYEPSKLAIRVRVPANARLMADTKTNEANESLLGGAGFERTTSRSVAGHSIQLNYPPEF